jgi:aminomethyltransferase
VQGPRAEALMGRLSQEDVAGLGYYRYVKGTVGGAPALISRTGYTGEDGFELYVVATDTPRLWQALRDAGEADGVRPIGLGARDTLRLEMRYALYGNDIDQTTNPVEAGLNWVVKPAKGEFLGRAVIERVRTEGPKRRLVGLEMADRAIARHGYPVVKDGQSVGVVTSGSFGPSVERSIALAYVPAVLAAVGTELGVEIRGEARPARVVKTPFHPSRVKKAA